LSSRFPGPAADINDAAQHSEQFGHALHLVQNHQSLALRQEKTFRIIQLALGRRQFQIKINGIAAPGHFGQRQRGFACLAWAKQDHCGEFGEQIRQFLLGETRIHPCNLSFLWKICTVLQRNRLNNTVSHWVEIGKTDEPPRRQDRQGKERFRIY
jgi:hypothetical protein